MKDEKTLCISTEELKDVFDLDKGFWRCNINLINSLSYTYIPRCSVESDYSFKQIIPYALVFNSAGEILYYQRCGSEKRLSGLCSAGIGGHVNDKDYGNSLYEKIIAGLKREMKEELGVNVSDNQLHFLGMINEELTDVGHCHIGMVFKIILEDCSLMDFENEIGHPNWEYPSMLDLSNFELWSALAIKLDLVSKRPV